MKKSAKLLTRNSYNKIKTQHKVFKKEKNKQLRFAGNDLVNHLRNAIISPPKTGRIYTLKIAGVRKLHQASAAGEYPANRTGNLLNKTFSRTSGELGQMEFGNNAEYMRYLERPADRSQARKGVQETTKVKSGQVRNRLRNAMRAIA